MISATILQRQVQERDIRIKQLEDELADYRESYRQIQDLAYAMFYKFGPKISIEVPNQQEFFKNAQFDGNLDLDSDGTFRAEITFYLDGKPQTNEPT